MDVKKTGHKQYEVSSDSSIGQYNVHLDVENFGCECEHWMFRLKPKAKHVLRSGNTPPSNLVCKHIKACQEAESKQTKETKQTEPMPDKENLSKKPIVEAEHGAIEAEEGVLACIMLEPEGALLDTVVAMGLDVDDFSTSANQEMFRAMQQLRNDKKPIDEIVLLEALTKAGEADRIGGLDGIFKIQKRVETSTHIKYLAEIVLSRSQSRKLRRALREGCEELASGSPADQVSSKIEQHIKTRLAQVGEDETVAKASQDIEDDLKAMMNGTYECRGVPTRIKAIDDMMGAEGMAPGSVTIISAATSCGKSALALNMALRHAVET